jgi:DNA-binding NtrC family response regulator
MSERPQEQETVVFEFAALPASIRRTRFRLKQEDGPQELVTSEPRVVIGSGPSADFLVPDATVSRLHCEIVADDSGYLIRDLGSTNGTVIGGVRVKESYLASAARIRAGRATIRFSLLDNADEVALYPDISFGEMVARSAAMRALFSRLARVAKRDTTLLLEGESGTGKELAARAVHAASQRRTGPFVVVDCSAIPRNLVEAELFGHVKGAFTGATQTRPGKFVAAQGGTIFLDEIGELDLDMQPRLLRVLERREVHPVGATAPVPVDVRVISATNRNLRREVNNRTFREDLFYRLAVTSATLPPLRERTEDIPLLIDHFLAQHSAKDGFKYELDRHTRRRLHERPWPGNIRELRNAVEELVVLGEESEQPESASLPSGAVTLGIEPHTPSGAGSSCAIASFKEEKARLISTFEADYLKRLLQIHRNNFSASAMSAGLDRVHFLRLLDKHSLRK